MLGCVELFAGAGGLSLGLRQAGFTLLGAHDISPAAVSTYRANLGDHAKVGDVRTLTGQGLIADPGTDDGELSLLAGGPPCQGFSKQKRGAHLGADDRNQLVFEWSRLVREAAPKAFIFENVEVFGQARGRDILAKAMEDLGDWTVYPMFLNTADYGMAQRRMRFVMIGLRRDLHAPAPVLMTSPSVTIRDVLGNLPPPPVDGSDHPMHPNHSSARITDLNRERFSHVPPGGGWQDIPYALRLRCHQTISNDGDATIASKKGGWPDVYGRLEWEGQCPTLTAGFDSFTRGRYGHPEQHRALTLREGARLQGFPDWFEFKGNRSEIRLQIGNAVPPPLGRVLGEAVRRCLENEMA